jgi:predicted ribosomally synthesized peptide with nif11-like leader
MSNESFKLFLAKIENDTGLRQEIRAAGGEAGMPVEAVVAFAAAKGYDFKVEDVSNELSDAALENVAGGGAQPHMTGGILSHDIAFQKIDGVSAYLSAAGAQILKF